MQALHYLMIVIRLGGTKRVRSARQNHNHSQQAVQSLPFVLPVSSVKTELPGLNQQLIKYQKMN